MRETEAGQVKDALWALERLERLGWHAGDLATIRCTLEGLGEPVAWRIKKPPHVGNGWWWYTDALVVQDELAAWREDGYELVHETLYAMRRS